MTPDDPRHGTPAGRHVHKADGEPACDACRHAAARYEKELQLDRLNGRPRSVPALGTRRRIQALVALGHTFRAIGEALGITDKGAQALAHRPNQTVYASTAGKVAALFETWSMRLPPQTTTGQRKAASYARTVARRNGWLPPLAWDDIDHDLQPSYAQGHSTEVDWVVVERFLAGDVVPTTTPDRHVITDAWLDAGRSWNDLERLTGWRHGRYGRTRRQEPTAA